MGFKQQKQKKPNPPQQDSPIPFIPCKQPLWQPTPGLSGTQWSEDLFHEPFQQNEPPITGLSQSSDSQLPSHENNSTVEPEPEVDLMQSTGDPFAGPATPHSIIIMNDNPVETPHLPLLFRILPPVPSPEIPPVASKNLITSSPRCQSHLIATMSVRCGYETLIKNQVLFLSSKFV
ncbi:hypothetical protein O181_045398 [Austropuccinia psidii MF-1]|uniref:Uncharacterized protein n=1 Tax=Austropuccinia psidii MF-1 TaxID=1389203 RepID=A0A9Q3DQ96_9BASI|nr:hypothetical protein [Austropuccinia psidii MF-1]